MQIRCKPGSLEDKDNKAESGPSSKIMQKHSKLGSLEDQGPKSKISKINFASWIRGFWKHVFHPFFWRIRIQKLNLDLVPRSCKYAVNQLVWRIRIRKLNLDLVPRSCKYTVNKVVWRIRIPKLNLDLVPKSCKNTQNQVVWRVRVRKVRFPKLILHRGLEAFVDISIHLFHLFLKDQDPKTESRFSPKIMQIRCKATGLEDQDPKTESRFSPKIMQINCKQGGLEMFGGSGSKNWIWILSQNHANLL